MTADSETGGAPTTDAGRPLHILLTNDDGVLAPGLIAMHDALAAAGHRVTIVAPSEERSGSSHAIAIWRHLEARRVEHNGAPWGWAFDSTPADCVKLALGHLLRDDPPDLVVSGINPGPNIGDAVFYSGTVAAAAEAAFYGRPAIAVSIASRFGEPRHYDGAAEFTAHLAAIVARDGLPERCLLNVNAPNLPAGEMAGVVATMQGVSAYLDQMTRTGGDAAGTRAQFRNEGKQMRMSPGDGDWDDRVLEQGFISVTPLRLDLTDHALGRQVQRWLGELMPGRVRHAAHVERPPRVEAWSPFPVGTGTTEDVAPPPAAAAADEPTQIAELREER